MPIFSWKEKRKHYTAVANGTKPVKANSKFTPEEQRAYARGQRDAMNDQAVGFVLGKNSKLSAAEKQALKDKRKAERKAWRDRRKSGKV